MGDRTVVGGDFVFGARHRQSRSGWQIGTDIQNDNTLVSNVNIVLVDVPGGVPVLSGSNNAYPASASH
jgi:hypothetical protein